MMSQTPEENQYWSLLMTTQEHHYPDFVAHLKQQKGPTGEEGRAAVIDFHDGKKPLIKKCHNSRQLRRCLDRPAETGIQPVSRRLVVLEGLPRKFVQLLGSKFRVPPDFFSAHWIEPDSYTGSMINRSPRHYDNQSRCLLSFMKLHRAAIIKPQEDSSEPLYFMESSSRRFLSRLTIFGDSDGPLRSLDQASFWTKSEGESWVAIVLVDPPLGGWVKWRNDHTSRGVAHDSTIPLVSVENLKGLEQRGSWFPLYQSQASLNPDSNEWLDSERHPEMRSLFDDMLLLYPLRIRTSTANPNDCNDICRRLVLAEWTARLRIMEAEIARERLRLSIPESDAASGIDELLETSWPGSWSPKDFARLDRAKTVLEAIKVELRRNLRALGVGGSDTAETTTRIISPWETDAWEGLHETVGMMASTVEGLMQAYIQTLSVRQMLSANEQAVQVGRLTSMATIILPVSLVAAIFSMGGEFAAGERMFWVFWAIAVPMVLVGCFLLFTTAGRNVLR